MLIGRNARLAWRGARVRDHLLPHHESALWNAGRDGLPEISRALERLEPLRRFRDEHGRELLAVADETLENACSRRYARAS